ncbi:serine/Arginine-related protein 53-like [Lingula anatina]|uniref:Serine/Arginine-related protein 53-like n=1 Tax=Lingula anatina TaxID=7574 RepID=A0A1S3JYN0_LINAN|nr:serine/Arginine-related protein 53-like [Lingula anatina]|eukprot:XP_013415498.1 serine/Arginine-related protein 53-like [Lingula anatina]
MGRHSDTDSEDDRRSKQKKKRRSRSYSPDSQSSYSKKSKHKKSKKSKSKKRSRSRSRSTERSKDSRRRSRSRSTERRRRSRSRSPDYRKRSRSSSLDRRRRSRSRSRERRSRSRSRDRRSRSRSRERRSRRSSRSRERSRRSRSRSRDRYQRSRSRESTKEIKVPTSDPCSDIPGFQDLDPAEQNKIRLQMALKAAADADNKLKAQGLIEGRTRAMELTDQLERQKAIEEIEEQGFVPQSFTSGSSKDTTVQQKQGAHESAIFGRSYSSFTSVKKEPNTETTGKIVYRDTGSLLHPSLCVSAEEKMERWKKKVAEYRRKKLEGEAMV